MSEKQQLEFFLLRYVPHAVQDEFVNIGVVLLAGEGSGFADVRFIHDWRRVLCLDPGADVEWLQALERDVRMRLQDAAGRADILYRLQDLCSNAVQVTASKACLGEEPAKELETLTRVYLESRVTAGSARAMSGRRRIVAAMRSAFEREGVWELMRKEIAAETYTYKGDPLKIDCGYRPNGVIKMFHGVSLGTDVDAAKVLAFSYPQLEAGILRDEKAKTSLTAVVEDGLDRADEAVLFALAVMERSGIGVAKVSEVAGLAEVARRELRV
jgi:Protein of unknown function (DUF3037)